MRISSQRRHFISLHKLVVGFVILSLASNPAIPLRGVCAQEVPHLPEPGTMITMSSSFHPPLIRGLAINPQNPFEFTFIIDGGDDNLKGDILKAESEKLIKYFLASMTVPETEMWVNLSPYEKNRIIPDNFGRTEMGRDLLSQDYMLKQLTASLMYPEEKLGRDFWKRVHSKAYAQFGTTEIPMNTFNKVWIVPEKARVYVNDNNVFVVENHLKVMLEEDYLALEANRNSTKHGLGNVTKEDIDVISGVSSQVIKEVLIPEIEKEVNEGKTFANLRQIFNSMILATWYKQNLKESLLGAVYVDQAKTEGIESQDIDINEKIYAQYVEAFKKGVYDYIKEDYDPVKQDIVTRRYFSGGVKLATEVGEDSMAVEARRVMAGRTLHQVTSRFDDVEGQISFDTGQQQSVDTVMDRPIAPLSLRENNRLDFKAAAIRERALNQFEMDIPLRSQIDRIIEAMNEQLSPRAMKNLIILGRIVHADPDRTVEGKNINALNLVEEFAHVRGMADFLKGINVIDFNLLQNNFRELLVAHNLVKNNQYLIEGLGLKQGKKELDIIARKADGSRLAHFEVQDGRLLADSQGNIKTGTLSQLSEGGLLPWLYRQFEEHNVNIDGRFVGDLRIEAGQDGHPTIRVELVSDVEKAKTVNHVVGPEVAQKIQELFDRKDPGLNALLEKFPNVKIRLDIEADISLPEIFDNPLNGELVQEMDGLAGDIEAEEHEHVKQLAKEFKMSPVPFVSMFNKGLIPDVIRKRVEDLGEDKRQMIREELGKIKKKNQKQRWLVENFPELFLQDSPIIEEQSRIVVPPGRLASPGSQITPEGEGETVGPAIRETELSFYDYHSSIDFLVEELEYLKRNGADFDVDAMMDSVRPLTEPSVDLDQFIEYLTQFDVDRPSERQFRGSLRRVFEELFGIPKNRIIFVSAEGRSPWMPLTYNSLEGDDVKNDFAAQEITFTDGTGRTERVILVRDDLVRSEHFRLSRHESAHFLQDELAIRRIIEPLFGQLIEGFQSHMEDALLDMIDDNADSLGEDAREILKYRPSSGQIGYPHLKRFADSIINKVGKEPLRQLFITGHYDQLKNSLLPGQFEALIEFFRLWTESNTFTDGQLGGLSRGLSCALANGLLLDVSSPEGIQRRLQKLKSFVSVLSTVLKNLYSEEIERGESITLDNILDRLGENSIPRFVLLAIDFALEDMDQVALGDAMVDLLVGPEAGEDSMAVTEPTESLSQTSQEKKEFKKGGIDLNPNIMDLQSEGDKVKYTVPLDLKNIQNIEINGLVPIIINITPVTNLPYLLGEGESQKNPQLSRANTF